MAWARSSVRIVNTGQVKCARGPRGTGQPLGLPQVKETLSELDAFAVTPGTKFIPPMEFGGAFLVRRGSLRSRAADGLLASRCHGEFRGCLQLVSARARGGRLPRPPRQTWCENSPVQAQEPPKGRGWDLGVSRAPRLFLRWSRTPREPRHLLWTPGEKVFPRASGKAVPPAWEQLGGFPVGQVVSLVSGDRARGGALQTCVGKPNVHGLSTIKL